MLCLVLISLAYALITYSTSDTKMQRQGALRQYIAECLKYEVSPTFVISVVFAILYVLHLS